MHFRYIELADRGSPLGFASMMLRNCINTLRWTIRPVVKVCRENSLVNKNFMFAGEQFRKNL